MAKELLVSTTTGKTVYALCRVPQGANVGKWANVDDETLDDYAAEDLGKYDVTMTELGASGLYEGNIPRALKAERTVEVIYYEQAGSDPAESDTKISASLYEFGDQWVATISLTV